MLAVIFADARCVSPATILTPSAKSRVLSATRMRSLARQSLCVHLAEPSVERRCRARAGRSFPFRLPTCSCGIASPEWKWEVLGNADQEEPHHGFGSRDRRRVLAAARTECR